MSLALDNNVKEELNNNFEYDILTKVQMPTEWKTTWLYCIRQDN